MINTYKVWCETEQAYVESHGYTVPTKCPNNTSHTIQTDPVPAIVASFGPTIVKIKDETTETGGNFSTSAVTVDVPAGGTQIVDTVYDFPISAFGISIMSDASHTKDSFDVIAAPDAIIGYITHPLSPPSSYDESTTYNQYDHVIYNNKLYTALTQTTGAFNTTAWQKGYGVRVSSTVSTYAVIGRWINLFNGAVSNDCGRVIGVANLMIYLSKAPTISFSPGVLVRMNIYIVENYVFGSPGVHDIGSRVIGGTYIPANTIVRIVYRNSSTTTDKFITGYYEYKY